MKSEDRSDGQFEWRLFFTPNAGPEPLELRRVGVGRAPRGPSGPWTDDDAEVRNPDARRDWQL